MSTTSAQFGAIKNGSTQGSLVNQLYAGKPQSQNPSVIAASSNVQTSTPQSSVPKTPISIPQPKSGVSGGSSALALSPGQFGTPPPPAPSNQTVKSHTVKDANGNTTTQTYETPTPQSNASATNPITPQDPLASGSSTSGIVPIPNAQPNSGSIQPIPNADGNYTLTPVSSQTSPSDGASYQGFLGKLYSQIGDTSAVDKANQDLQGLRNQYAKAVTNIETGSPGLPLEFVQGREQVLNRQYAAQESAAQQALTNALTERGQNITGATSGAGASAPGTAYSQVSPGNVAIDSTGKPVISPLQVGTPGQAQYSSLGGSQGGITPEIMQQYAQMAANGQITSIPSSITGNPVLNAQLNDAAKKLNSNYNPVSSAAQSGIITKQAETKAAYESAHQQAQNLQSQLTDLITKFNLNPADLNKANLGIQAIAANTSDPRYKILDNYLTDVASRYAQVLTPAGGSQTDTVRNTAQGMLDGIASGNSIISVMNALDQQAQAVIAGVNTPYGGGTSGGPVSWDDVL